MRLGQHLVELRKRLIICAATVAVAAIGGWFLSDMVWDFLRAPVAEIARTSGRNAQITFSDVTSSFDLKIKVSIFIAIVLGSPVWFYQIWAFLAPGLKRREKLLGVGFLAAAVPLFLVGCYAGWWVLPNIVHLLTGFSSAQDALLLDARQYLDFATKLMFAIGIGFVLPVLVVLLNFAGVLSAQAILRSWRIAIIAIVVFAAATTPAAEVMTMFFLAVPMIFLYFLAAFIAWLHDRRKAKILRVELAEYEDR